MTPERRREIAKSAAIRIAAHGVSRASVAVMHDDRLVLAAGYGGRGATERVPVWICT
jgi:hypothetical protein